VKPHLLLYLYIFIMLKVSLFDNICKAMFKRVRQLVVVINMNQFIY